MSKQTNKILGLLMNDDVDVFVKYSNVFFTGQIQLAPLERERYYSTRKRIFVSRSICRYITFHACLLFEQFTTVYFLKYDYSSHITNSK